MILDTVLVPGKSFICIHLLDDIDFAHYKLLMFGVITCCDLEIAWASGQFALSDRHFYFNPKADFRVKGHDILVLMGFETVCIIFVAYCKRVSSW